MKIFQEGMKTLKVEYDVYAKLHGNNLEILNLTVCRQRKITISIPIVLPENIDIFNSSSGYYNDICYTTSSEYGTDILLKDRQKEFIDKNKIVCQEDCEFSEYNYEALIAKCSCNVKASSKSFAEMNINKEKLLENFKNIKNIINFSFLICYKKLFKKEGIINNIGSYLLLIIIFFHIFSIFIFYINQFPLLKKRILDIFVEIFKYHSRKVYKNKNKKVHQFDNKNMNKIGIKKINKIENKSKSKIKFQKDNKKGKKVDSKKNIDISGKEIFIYKNSFNKNNIKKNYVNNKPSYYFVKNQIKKNVDIKNNHKFEKINNLKNINKFIDEEINGLPYNLALQYDKRAYFDYYFSLLKTKHNLIFALCNHSDYNSGIIKIDLFLIGFTIDYTVNALFYNDDTMHKIYESKGQFDILSQLPIIIYSYLISLILNTPLNSLALSNDAILDFKQNKSKNDIMNRTEKLKKILSFKFILYFIVSFLFLIFFWYYISMFSVIYKNTQIHLLKDTLMSLGLSLVVPFVIYLLPGLFRIPSLQHKKRNCLFNISKILQSF